MPSLPCTATEQLDFYDFGTHFHASTTFLTGFVLTLLPPFIVNQDENKKSYKAVNNMICEITPSSSPYPSMEQFGSFPIYKKNHIHLGVVLCLPTIPPFKFFRITLRCSHGVKLSTQSSQGSWARRPQGGGISGESSRMRKTRLARQGIGKNPGSRGHRGGGRG